MADSKTVFDVEARVTMNERPLEGEGGRVVVHAEDLPDGLRQVEVIVNAATDAAMEVFPESRADRQSRRFRIIVQEEAAAE